MWSYRHFFHRHPSIPKSGNVYWEREIEREIICIFDIVPFIPTRFESTSVSRKTQALVLLKIRARAICKALHWKTLLITSPGSSAKFRICMSSANLGIAFGVYTIFEMRRPPIFQSLLKTMILEHPSTIWNKQKVYWGDPGQHLGRWLRNSTPYIFFLCTALQISIMRTSGHR